MAPGSMVTVAGTVALVSEEETFRTNPSGAGASMVTVPVAVVPPAMSAGVTTSPVTAGALTRRLSVAVLKMPSCPVTVTGTSVGTATVVMTMLVPTAGVVLPAGIVT